MARLFVQQFAEQLGRPVVDISPPAMALLLQHSWPGNVRELKHVLERAVLMTSNPALTAADIQISGCTSAETEDPSFRAAKARAVRSFERAFIERLLQAHSGNVTQAARAARKNRRAFFELMRKHGHRVQPLSGRRAEFARGTRPGLVIAELAGLKGDAARFKATSELVGFAFRVYRGQQKHWGRLVTDFG